MRFTFLILYIYVLNLKKISFKSHWPETQSQHQTDCFIWTTKVVSKQGGDIMEIILHCRLWLRLRVRNLHFALQPLRWASVSYSRAISISTVVELNPPEILPESAKFNARLADGRIKYSQRLDLWGNSGRKRTGRGGGSVGKINLPVSKILRFSRVGVAYSAPCRAHMLWLSPWIFFIFPSLSTQSCPWVGLGWVHYSRSAKNLKALR